MTVLSGLVGTQSSRAATKSHNVKYSNSSKNVELLNASGGTTEYYLWHHSALSRHYVAKCANCLTHLVVNAHSSLSNMPDSTVDEAGYRIEIQQRGTELPTRLT